MFGNQFQINFIHSVCRRWQHFFFDVQKSICIVRIHVFAAVFDDEGNFEYFYKVKAIEIHKIPIKCVNIEMFESIHQFAYFNGMFGLQCFCTAASFAYGKISLVPFMYVCDSFISCIYCVLLFFYVHFHRVWILRKSFWLYEGGGFCILFMIFTFICFAYLLFFIKLYSEISIVLQFWDLCVFFVHLLSLHRVQISFAFDFFKYIFFVFILSCTWENFKWSASEGSAIKLLFRLITMFGLILKMYILHFSRCFCVCMCNVFSCIKMSYVRGCFLYVFLVLGVRWWLLIGVLCACLFVSSGFLIVIFLFDLIDNNSLFDVFLLLLCGCGCCSFCCCCCSLMFWLVISVKHISVDLKEA